MIRCVERFLGGNVLEKAAAIILIFCLVALSAAPLGARADETGLCYIALNEAFADGALAYFSGSAAYVPIDCFADFKLYNSYHAADDTATLFSSSKQLFFELDTGRTYDSSDNYYNTSAIRRNGQVYVPVSFVCSQFGFSYSIIEGVGYGDVCRIKDSSYTLSDSQFLSAAESLMRSLYEQYSGGGISAPGSTDVAQPGDMDDPVYLSFQGLPSSALIDTLLQFEVDAGFFLTADDIRTSPETVRRLAAEGFSLGALLGAEPARGVRGLLLPALRGRARKDAAGLRRHAGARGRGERHGRHGGARLLGLRRGRRAGRRGHQLRLHGHGLYRVPARAGGRAHPVQRADGLLHRLRAAVFPGQRLLRARPK